MERRGSREGLTVRTLHHYDELGLLTRHGPRQPWRYSGSPWLGRSRRPGSYRGSERRWPPSSAATSTAGEGQLNRPGVASGWTAVTCGAFSVVDGRGAVPTIGSCVDVPAR